MGEESIFCDTSLFLYLGRIKKASILPKLFKKVYVPEEVALELDAGRLLRADTINPRMLDWVEIVSVSQKDINGLPANQLGIGEGCVIAYSRANPKYVAGLDDRLARLFAEQLEIKVVGLIGILLTGKRIGLVPYIRPLLESASAQGFRMGKELFQEAMSLAGEES